MSHFQKAHPRVIFSEDSPDALIVLGGDGTILEATRGIEAGKGKRSPIIVGLNLGHVGFLAAVRSPKDFLTSLDRLIAGDFHVVSRMQLSTAVWRKAKNIYQTRALNEISVQSLLGIAEMTVSIRDHPIQKIRGNGVLVATATGTTAMNLSAHGPIVMPSIKCLIVTEILDHHIPTPPVVVKHTETVRITVTGFRRHGLLTLAHTGAPADVILASDDSQIFALEPGDVIEVRRSPRLIPFAEFEEHYFFKSLEEKFAFQ